ncbi:MAG: hypothetical protein FJZ90_00650, partial [Chloroflexi bacterium]|nr:hypothetical protein [Chloroflexota bacterium]
MPDDLDIWVLVYAPNGRYYPQLDEDPECDGEPPPSCSNGTWGVTTYLGETGQSTQFDIVCVVADQSASRFFMDRMIQWCRARSWPGLRPYELPPGIEEKDSISVRAGSLPAFTPTPTPSSTPTVGPTVCVPAVEFTHVPPYASFERLQGRVRCIDPASHKVAVYIYVSGWWTKPYWAWPLTDIEADGTWITDITTGGTDQLATKIAAFVVAEGYDPPAMGGERSLPDKLYTDAIAWTMTEREAVFRTIQFSGYTWKVKASETRAGPGPNYFSDRAEDVWVDEQGKLHMRIANRSGRWYCTEIITELPLGYGKYIFRTASRVDQLDKNVVLGLFTWDDEAPEHNYREIDIEFSRWGDADNDVGQYVVQPWEPSGNMYRFGMELRDVVSTHGFDWQEHRVVFQSLHGHQPFPGSKDDEIASWTYTGKDIPPEGNGNARINLWLMNGLAPSDGEGV